MVSRRVLGKRPFLGWVTVLVTNFIILILVRFRIKPEVQNHLARNRSLRVAYRRIDLGRRSSGPSPPRSRVLDLRSGHQRTPPEAPADGFEDYYNNNNDGGNLIKEENSSPPGGARGACYGEHHPNTTIRRWLNIGDRETLGELMT